MSGSVHPTEKVKVSQARRRLGEAYSRAGEARLAISGQLHADGVTGRPTDPGLLVHLTYNLTQADQTVARRHLELAKLLREEMATLYWRHRIRELQRELDASREAFKAAGGVIL